jgi:hypothetical protein
MRSEIMFYDLCAGNTQNIYLEYGETHVENYFILKKN